VTWEERSRVMAIVLWPSISETTFAWDSRSQEEGWPPCVAEIVEAKPERRAGGVLD
jgi:hypothetical protein